MADENIQFRIDADVASLLSGTNSAIKNFAKLDTAVKRTGDSFTIFGYSIDKWATKAGKAEMRFRQGKHWVATDKALQDMEDTVTSLGLQVEVLTKILDIADTSITEVGVASEETSRKTKENTETITLLGKSFEVSAITAQAFGYAMIAVGVAAKAVSIGLNAVKKVLSLVGKAFKILTTPVRAAARAMLEFLKRVAAVATGVLIRDAIFGIMRSFKELSAEIMKAVETFQTLEIRLLALSKRQILATEENLTLEQTLQKAAKGTQGLLKWMKDLSLVAPFDVEVIGNMQALNMAMGFGSGEAMRLTEATMTYTAAMGLSSEVMERITYNFGQMKAAGKVTGTEMRDLARGAFFPLTDVLQRAADKLGIAEDQFQEFRDAASEGAIDIDLFFESFVEMVEERFPNALEDMGRTLTGIKTRFKNFIKTVVGLEVLGPVVGRITERLADFMDTLTSPAIKRAAKWIGEALYRSFVVIEPALEELKNSIGEFFSALGFGTPIVEDFAYAILTAAYGMRTLIQFASHVISSIAEQITGLSLLSAPAEGWGYNIVANIARGMMKAAELIVKVINWITNLLSGWFAPGSPPKVAPDIDKWGTATMEEWLKGFTSADFDILEAIQSPLKSALDLLAEMEEISGKEASQAFVDISQAFIEAMAGGTVDENLFQQLNESAGEFGDAIEELARRNFDLVDSVKAVEAAEAALEAARRAHENAMKQVSKLVREYNQALRGGAADTQLAALRAQVNEQIKARDEAALAIVASETELDIAQQQLDVMKEMVDVQSKLVEQLILLAKAQLEAAPEEIELPEFPEAPDIGGGGEFEYPELPDFQLPGVGSWQDLREEIEKTGGAGVDAAKDIDNAFGDISFPTPEVSDLNQAFAAMQRELSGIFSGLLDELEGEFDAKFGEGGSLTAIVGTWSESWDGIWEGILSGWEDIKLRFEEIKTPLESIKTSLQGIIDNIGYVQEAFGVDIDVSGWSVIDTLLLDPIERKLDGFAQKLENLNLGLQYWIVTIGEAVISIEELGLVISGEKSPAQGIEDMASRIEDLRLQVTGQTEELPFLGIGMQNLAGETDTAALAVSGLESSVATTMPGIAGSFADASASTVADVAIIAGSLDSATGLGGEITWLEEATARELASMSGTFDTELTAAGDSAGALEDELGEEGLTNIVATMNEDTAAELVAFAETADTEFGNVITSTEELTTSLETEATNIDTALGDVETSIGDTATAFDDDFGTITSVSEAATIALQEDMADIVEAFLSTEEPIITAKDNLRIYVADGLDHVGGAVKKLGAKIIWLIDWVKKLNDALNGLDLVVFASEPPLAAGLLRVAEVIVDTFIPAINSMVKALNKVPSEKVLESVEALFNVAKGYGSFGGALVDRWEEGALGDMRDDYDEMVEKAEEFADSRDESAETQREWNDYVKELQEFLEDENITEEQRAEILQKIAEAEYQAYINGKSTDDAHMAWLRTLDKIDEAYAEIAKEQEKIAALEKAQADLNWLQDQFDFLEMIQAEGLKVDEILGGFELGIERDIPGLIEAMTRAMQALVDKAESELGISSPSKKFAMIGENIMATLGAAIMKTSRIPANAVANAMQSMTATSRAAPAYSNSYSNEVNVNMGGVSIYDNMDAATFAGLVRNIIQNEARGF